MVRPTTKEISDLQRKYDFFEDFDVCLAVQGAVTNPPQRMFYNDLASLIAENEKTGFKSYDYLNLSWGNDKVFEIITKIIIPLSDIVIYDSDNPSALSNYMIRSALENNIPHILLSRDNKVSLDLLRSDYLWALVEYDSMKDALKKTGKLIKGFYKNMAPLMPHA